MCDRGSVASRQQLIMQLHLAASGKTVKKRKYNKLYVINAIDAIPSSNIRRSAVAQIFIEWVAESQRHACDWNDEQSKIKSFGIDVMRDMPPSPDPIDATTGRVVVLFSASLFKMAYTHERKLKFRYGMNLKELPVASFVVGIFPTNGEQ